ncbi:MAG TPA: hypothetical protein VIL85_15095 [Thermomicrobiales bacterium]|jgi:hypothetical protein
MAVDRHDPADEGVTQGHTYRLDLARWWELLAEHLAHPSADIAVLELTPDRALVLQSGWDWAGVKSVLDQTMAVATTQLLQESVVPLEQSAATKDTE